MPREKKEKPNIVADVKAVLREDAGDNRKVQLRVVHWIADGKDTGAKLEKRSFFKKKDGGFSDMGSAKGFNKTDLEYIVGNWEELKMFFG